MNEVCDSLHTMSVLLYDIHFMCHLCSSSAHHDGLAKVRVTSLTTEPSFAIAVSDSSSALGRDGSLLSPTEPRGRILGYLVVGEYHLGGVFWELR